MLYLVGTGLKPEHVSIEGLNFLKNCDEVFVENYTSRFAEGNFEEMEKLVGKKIIPLNRKQVEEEFDEILQKAKTTEIGLLVQGNVFFATTHSQIVSDAKKENVKIKIVPGMSLFDFIGKTGLSLYKFGETVSIVFHEKNFKPDSFYDKIVKNNENGLHTLCLLDIKEEKLMTITEALKLLEKIEQKKKNNIIQKSPIVVLSVLGSDNEKISAGSFEELKKLKFESPASIIVCGELNENEKQALKELK